jgi:ribosome-associated protein
MTPEELINRINPAEFRFSASRSSGPGGQNVNKVNTRVELRFNIFNSPSLNGEEKALASAVLKNKINSEGDLLIVSQSERTQLQNKKKTEETFYRLVARALTPKTERKPTKPTAASRVRRIEQKKKRSLVKSMRKDNSGGFTND